MSFLFALYILFGTVVPTTISYPVSAKVPSSSNVFEVGDNVIVDFIRLDCRTQEEVDYFKGFKGGLIVIEVRGHLVTMQDSNCNEFALDQVFLMKLKDVPKGSFRPRCRISVGDRVHLNWVEWRHCQYDDKPPITEGTVIDTEENGHLLTIKNDKGKIYYFDRGFWKKV